MADINVGAGLLAPTAYDASVLTATAFDATAGALVIAGLAANVQSAILQDATGALTISGYSPSLNTGTSFTATAGALTIAGNNPALNAETSFSATAGGLLLDGYHATYINSTIEVSRVQGGIGAITISGYNPSVSASKQPGYHTLYMGICDENGENKQFVRRWVNPSGQVFFSLDTADIASPLSSSSVYCYVDVATDGWWYLDDAQLEFDTQDDTPGTWRHARGSSSTQTTEERKMSVRKVCPHCREQLQKFSENKGRPRVDWEPEIPSDMQEV